MRLKMPLDDPTREGRRKVDPRVIRSIAEQKMQRFQVYFFVAISFAFICVGILFKMTLQYEESQAPEPFALVGDKTFPKFPPVGSWVNAESFRGNVASDPHKALFKNKLSVVWFWNSRDPQSEIMAGEMKTLQKRFPDTLQLVAIHYPSNEGEADDLFVWRQAARWGMECPVFNDRLGILGREFRLRPGPAVVLLDPEGKIVFVHPGVGVQEPLSDFLLQMQKHFMALRALAVGTVLKTSFTKSSGGPSLNLNSGDTLTIADTLFGITLTSKDGQKSKMVVGNGKLNPSIGLSFPEGDSQVPFQAPGGMALWKNELVIFSLPAVNVLYQWSAKSQEFKVFAGKAIGDSRDGNLEEVLFHAPGPMSSLSSSAGDLRGVFILEQRTGNLRFLSASEAKLGKTKEESVSTVLQLPEGFWAEMVWDKETQTLWLFDHQHLQIAHISVPSHWTPSKQLKYRILSFPKELVLLKRVWMLSLENESSQMSLKAVSWDDENNNPDYTFTEIGIQKGRLWVKNTDL